MGGALRRCRAFTARSWPPRSSSANDAELTALHEQVERLAQGEGGIVTITGEAGIGKSRLLGELASLDVVRSARLLEGRSLSLGADRRAICLNFRSILN